MVLGLSSILDPNAAQTSSTAVRLLLGTRPSPSKSSHLPEDLEWEEFVLEVKMFQYTNLEFRET